MVSELRDSSPVKQWRGHSTRGGGYRSEVALDVLEGRLKDLDSELAASRFRVWGCLALVHDTSAEKISPHAIPSVFLGFPEDSSDFTFYHPPLHRFFYSRDVRFDESVPYYVRYPCRGLPVPPPPLFLTSAPPPAPQVQHPSSSHPTAHPTGAGVRGEDPGGASSRGVGVGAESIPVRGPGLGGAGVEAEPVPAGASSPRGANSGRGHVPAGDADSEGGATGALEGGAARVGASGERAGAAAAGATAAGGAAAAAAGAAAAAAAGGAGAAAAARAAVAAAAAAGAAAAAAAAAGAAAAATSASCLWSSDPRSPLSFSSPLPLSPCLWSHSALTASLSTPVTDY
ncbi:unnamed protein product [Closterium sp. NIES-54]